jgi:hypothetical protein
MRLDIGLDRRGTLGRYFGKITEVSVHDTLRSASYISQHSIQTDEEDSTDNGDRIALIEYDVPADFNFVGGNILLLRNDYWAPSWDGDGDVVLSQVASAGSGYVTDTSDFALGTTTYYRIFSQNQLGNFSYYEDSPLLQVDIEAFPDLTTLPELTSPELFAPLVNTVREGNKKVFLQWENFPADDRISRVEIYSSTDTYPVIDEDLGVSGELVFRGSVNDTKFVHRNLENDNPVYYTMINRDRFGRTSAPVNVASIPRLESDEIGIPLLDVNNIHYEIKDNTALTLIWDNPIEFKANLDAYFDERVILYGAVTNEFGELLTQGNVNMTMKVEAVAIADEQPEGVFNEPAVSVLNADDYFQFNIQHQENGIMRADIRFINDLRTLSLIQELRLSIQVYSFIPDVTSGLSGSETYNDNLFEFYSSPITVSVKKPFSITLANRDSREVVRECEVSMDDFTAGSLLQGTEITRKTVSKDGAYVRSQYPFVARLGLDWKGDAILSGPKITVAIWDATDNVCDESFDPVKIRRSRRVRLLDTDLELQQSQIEKLDEDGQPTGEYDTSTYVDIPMRVPDFTQGAILFVLVEHRGFRDRSQMYLLFENILRLDLTARAPAADGIDIAEQFASAYIIDPDDPSDVSKRTLVPNATPVRWELEKGLFAQDRPFYSMENVTGALGVYSRTTDGVANNVLFGPASGVVWHHLVDEEAGTVQFIGERYIVKAHVMYDNLSMSTTAPLEIFPLGSENRFGSRILMEFPDIKNRLWADGEDYSRLVISKDPNNPSVFSQYGSCFVNCALDLGAEIVVLDAGQLIHISTNSDVEILWGDIREDIDPYTGESVLIIGPNAHISMGEALVELDNSEQTYVYFRINAHFKPTAADTGGDSSISLSDVANLLNPCECLGISSNSPLRRDLGTEYTVSGRTTVTVDNSSVSLSGGGPLQSGVPPTIIVPEEPLKIQIVDKRVDSQPSDTVVVDGESINEIIIEVSFSDRPVPDGTPITVAISSRTEAASIISATSDVIYTQTLIDNNIDSVNARSYATLTLNPITAEESLSEQILFSSTYNKIGSVDRLVQACALIEWEPADAELGQVDLPDIFSGNLLAYDIAADSWVTTLSDMNHPRGYPNVNYH